MELMRSRGDSGASISAQIQNMNAGTARAYTTPSYPFSENARDARE
jgi:hypothetical protein